MNNTYAINTTRGKEFTVERELRAIGLHPWIAKRLDSKYIKEKREAVWYDVPYIPKLAFCVIPAIYWTDVTALKHVIGKPIPLTRRDIKGVKGFYIATRDGTERKWVPPVYGLEDFRSAVEQEYDDMERRKRNSDYQCKYQPGQALEILKGPFSGLPTQFQETVKRAHDEYARLRVSVSIMGRETPVELDPDSVRAVG